MTEKELNEIEQRCQAAPKGPWLVELTEHDTISYGPAKKAVRIGDYYWIQQTNSQSGLMVVATDSKMEPVGMIIQSDNPGDYQTVFDFLQKSSKGSNP